MKSLIIILLLIIFIVLVLFIRIGRVGGGDILDNAQSTEISCQLLYTPVIQIEKKEAKIVVSLVKKEEIKGQSGDVVVDMINEERRLSNVAGVSINSKLVASATAKACDLRDKGYWSHNTPDGDAPWVFFIEAGYLYHYAGENLCRAGNDIECMKDFMASPKHKQNILDKNFKEVGVGRCGNFLVQHFGSRI